MNYVFLRCPSCGNTSYWCTEAAATYNKHIVDSFFCSKCEHVFDLSPDCVMIRETREADDFHWVMDKLLDQSTSMSAKLQSPFKAPFIFKYIPRNVEEF